jgi:hypothetical protein
MFKLFAELIAFHLDAQESLRASDAERREERRTAELREPYAMRQRRGAQVSSSSASTSASSSAWLKPAGVSPVPAARQWAMSSRRLAA